MKASRLLLVVGLLLLDWGCDETPQRHGDGAAQDFMTIDGGFVGDGALGDLLFSDGLASPDAPAIDPNKDSDGDGLPDGFEALYSGFDPQDEDSDGDGTKDGDEDDDGDGLSAKAEWAAWQLNPVEGQLASPLHKDLLVELDYQQGMAPSAALMQQAIEAYAALSVANPDGTPGVALHLYIDEKNLPQQEMQEPLTDRLNYLGSHGPTFSGSHAHVAKMVHVVFASKRPGSASRGGDTIGSSSESVDKAGVLVYVGNLQQIFPMCNGAGSPEVTVHEAVLSTFIHEVGHTLQLGHDTSAGGAVNPYNIMSTNLGDCAELKKRTRGIGNTDSDLGATETVGRPRFSKAAAQLIKLKNKISVDTQELVNGTGYEM